MGKSSKSKTEESSSSFFKDALSHRSKSPWTVPIVVLLLSNVLIFQLASVVPSLMTVSMMSVYQIERSYRDATVPGNKGSAFTPSSSSAGTLQGHDNGRGLVSTTTGWNPLDPIAIPPGQAQNLPSVRVEDADLTKKRKFYGGSGDKKHLGGFTEIDLGGISPHVWSKMMQEYGVRSFLDVGCGRGTSSLFFLEHGCDVMCAEGSHDAVLQSLLPQDNIVEHDFSRGPWWPGKTYDAAWSVEFLEHVSRQYHFNYISAYRKAALIFVTSSRWGGWHHVEIHPDDWWIRKYELYGFKYEPELTKQVKAWVNEEKRNATLAPNGKPYYAQHLQLSLKVFSNPMVAALPEHQHLFPRHGCFKEYSQVPGAFRSVTRPCGVGKGTELETALPPEYLPLPNTPEMYQRWFDKVKAGLPRNQQSS